MFKVLLLQRWWHLSDREMENAVATRPPNVQRVLNKIFESEKKRALAIALQEPELSAGDLA